MTSSREERGSDSCHPAFEHSERQVHDLVLPLLGFGRFRDEQKVIYDRSDGLTLPSDDEKPGHGSTGTNALSRKTGQRPEVVREEDSTLRGCPLEDIRVVRSSKPRILKPKDFRFGLAALEGAGGRGR